MIDKYHLRRSDDLIDGANVTLGVPSQRREPKNSIQYVQKNPETVKISKILNKDTIHLYYQNVRSMSSEGKQKDILETFDEHCSGYDIMALTETWLKPGANIIDGIFKGFDVYRRDAREDEHGVLVAISSNLYSDLVIIEGFDHLEFVCVKLFHKNHFIYIYCLYIEPGRSQGVYKEHIKAIEKIQHSKNDTLFIIGDFNIPNVEWEEDGERGSFVTTSKSRKIQLFKGKIFECQLNGILNDACNILDFAYVNNTDGISSEKVQSEFFFSKEDPSHPPFEILIESISSFEGFEKSVKEYAYSVKNKIINNHISDLESIFEKLDDEFKWRIEKETYEEREQERKRQVASIDLNSS